MEVKCSGCGREQDVEETEIARGPVTFRCDGCEAEHVVTKSGCRPLPRRVTDLPEVAGDADPDRLIDIFELGSRFDAGRAWRVAEEELVDAPDSVRQRIRASVPPGTLAQRFPGPRVAVGLAAVAVVGTLAIAHATTGTRAAATERTPQPVVELQGPATPADIIASVPPTRPAVVEEVAVAPSEAPVATAPTPAVKKKAAAPQRAPAAAALVGDGPAPTPPAAAPPTLLDAMRAAVKKGH